MKNIQTIVKVITVLSVCAAVATVATVIDKPQGKTFLDRLLTLMVGALVVISVSVYTSKKSK